MADIAPLTFRGIVTFPPGIQEMIQGIDPGGRSSDRSGHSQVSLTAVGQTDPLLHGQKNAIHHNVPFRSSIIMSDLLLSTLFEGLCGESH